MLEGAAGALAGLKVLDLSRVRAGPTCTRVLADFGADVIRVEPLPGQDRNDNMSGPRDGYDMQNLHRNKRSLTLDLKSEAGRDAFLRLAETADIVVENFRPGVMDRLGIGWPVLSAANPRLILCSISGYGQTGPYAEKPAFDQIVQGIGGMMSINGMPEQPPLRAGIAIADTSAGLYAVIGLLVAVVERMASGTGQWVQTSLLESQIAMLDFQAARYLIDGVVPAPVGNEHPYISPMGVFDTADGCINIGVCGDGMWRDFCAAFPHLRMQDDARYVTQELRSEHRGALRIILHAEFSTRSTEDLLDLLDLHGIPAGRINTIQQTFDDPQVRHLQLTQPVKHAGRGLLDLLRLPLTMSRTPPQIRSAAPDQGADSDDILGEIAMPVVRPDAG